MPDSSKRWLFNVLQSFSNFSSVAGRSGFLSFSKFARANTNKPEMVELGQNFRVDCMNVISGPMVPLLHDGQKFTGMRASGEIARISASLKPR